MVSPRVLDTRGAIAIELVAGLPDRSGTRAKGGGEGRIDVLDYRCSRDGISPYSSAPAEIIINAPHREELVGLVRCDP
jgi:hypothetical protein